MKVRRSAILAAGVLFVAGTVLVIGATASRSVTAAFVLAAVVAAAATTLRFRGAVLLVVMAAAYGARRLGPAGANLSFADGFLLLGAVSALPFVSWGSARLRRILVSFIAYESCLALAVFSHPTARAVVEWGHRILLVVGALLVGAAIARTGRVTPALRLYMATSSAVAVAAIGYALARGLAPAFPLGLQKNDAGLLLAYAFLIAILAPGVVRVPPRLMTPLRVLLVLGLLSTQSRGPMLASIAVLGVLQLRGRRSRRAALLVVVATLAMGAVSLAITQSQAKRARDNPGTGQFFGVGARESTYKQALTIWSHERVLGAGIRYFRDPSFQTSEPHDVVVVTLAESGLVGLFGLTLLLVPTWFSLRGLRGELATLARCVLVVQFLAGSVDIYWVAGRGSFPWILIGMAVGAEVIRQIPSESTLA